MRCFTANLHLGREKIRDGELSARPFATIKERILSRSIELLFLGLLYCGVAFFCRERRERHEEQQSVPLIAMSPAADVPVPIQEPTPVTMNAIPIATDDEPVLVRPKISRAIEPRPECGQQPDTLTPVAMTQPLPTVPRIQQRQVQYHCNCRRCRRGR